jgi:hypothetical protein
VYEIAQSVPQKPTANAPTAAAAKEVAHEGFTLTVKGDGLMMDLRDEQLNCSVQRLSIDWGDGTIDAYVPCEGDYFEHVYQESAPHSVSVIAENLTHLSFIPSVDYEQDFQITALDVSHCVDLMVLNCGDNKIASLDVTQNTKLKKLHCRFNLLTALDVSRNTDLIWLECYNNQLTSVDVTHNPHLIHLSCSDNHLTGLNLSQNTELESVSCGDNQLTSLDISNEAARLESLHFTNNRMSTQAINKLFASLPLFKMHRRAGDGGMSSTEGTIHFKGNPCGTHFEESIATEKGWILYY